MNVNLPEEATVPEAAKYLSVTQETVRRNIREKRLRAIKHGTQWFVPRDDLIQFANTYDNKTGKRTLLL